MFVFEAMLLTFMTTPVVTILYPPEVRKRAISTGADFATVVDKSGGDMPREAEDGIKRAMHESDETWKGRFTVVLDRIEHLPGMMTLTQLIHSPLPHSRDSTGDISSESRTISFDGGSRRIDDRMHNVSIDALRLIELSDRTSAVMKSSAADQLILSDPLLAIFKTFGDLNDLSISSSLSVVTFNDLASRVADYAKETMSQLVLVPWLPPNLSPTRGTSDAPVTPNAAATPSTNPFDILFRNTASVEKAASLVHSQFIRGIFAQCDTDVALYVDRTDKMRSSLPNNRNRSGRQQIFLPFFGGPDDRLALEFVVQLAANPRITATVVRITTIEPLHEEATPERPALAHTTGHDVGDADGAQTVNTRTMMTVTSVSSVSFSSEFFSAHVSQLTGQPDTVYGQVTTQTRLQSETRDNIAWARYAAPSADERHPQRVVDALTRITFTQLRTARPLHTVVEQANALLGQGEVTPQDGDLAQSQSRSNNRSLIVVLGRSRRLAVENHQRELKELVESYGGVGGEMKRTVGDVATALIVSGCDAGLVVMQTASRSSGL